MPHMPTITTCQQSPHANNHHMPTITTCQQSPHGVQHLFNCLKKPTTLTSLDLWEQPTPVAVPQAGSAKNVSFVSANNQPVTTTTVLPPLQFVLKSPVVTIALSCHTISPIFF